jgi:adenylate cyclase
VIGDDVNLASRLEGMTKEYGVQILISANTYRQVAGEYVCRPLDLIRVKGKLQPVEIYELLARRQEGGGYAGLLERFAEARSSYLAHRWDDAIAQFEDLLQHYPGDGPARLFLARLQEFRTQAPSPEWDGVYVMDHK